jgi:hypothetical protein
VISTAKQCHRRVSREWQTFLRTDGGGVMGGGGIFRGHPDNLEGDVNFYVKTFVGGRKIPVTLV